MPAGQETVIVPAADCEVRFGGLVLILAGPLAGCLGHARGRSADALRVEISRAQLEEHADAGS